LKITEIQPDMEKAGPAKARLFSAFEE